MPINIESSSNGESQPNSKITPWDKLKKVPFVAADKLKRWSFSLASKPPKSNLEQSAPSPAPIKQETELPLDPENDVLQHTKKESLEQDNDFLEAMDEHRREQSVLYRAERAQELTERKFNEIMTTPDKLELAIMTGEDGISAQEIDYQGKKIKVYDLEGYPVRFLQHVVDYKREGSVGSDKSNEIIQDPSKWIMNEEGMTKSATWASDNISNSYIDSDINLERNRGCHSVKGVTYGFSQIPGGALIKLRNGDGSTARNEASITKGQINNYIDPTAFADRRNAPGIYNEVVVKRYNENGEAIRPDYMILHDRGPYDKRYDQLTEYTLRHAAFFGIPIVRIHDRVYKERALKKMANNIERLNENDPYLEISSVLQSAITSNMLHTDLCLMQEYFKNEAHYDMPRNMHVDYTDELPNNMGEKLRYFVTEIEPTKRLDYIEKSLPTADKEQVSIFNGVTSIGQDETGHPIFGEMIEIEMPGVPRTVIRSDNPNYSRIKAATDKHKNSVNENRTAETARDHERQLGVEISNLSPNDNFEQVAEALYLIDQYIFPDLFGNADKAKNFAKAIFSEDKNALFSYDKTLVAKDDDNNIIGVLVYRDDNCTPWNTEAVRERFKATGLDLPEQFDRANDRYMKKITDAELPEGAVEIEFVGVREDYRSNGIGGRLMKAVIDRPEYTEAHLDVLDSHPGARRLYDKLGFNPFGDKFGNYPDGTEGVQHMVRKK